MEKNKIKCESCNYECSKQSDMIKHYSSKKHQRNNNGIDFSPPMQSEITLCKCGKKYKHHSGLWRHLKQCNFVESTDNENTEITNEPTESTTEFVFNFDFLDTMSLDTLKMMLTNTIKHNQKLQNQINQITITQK